MSSDLQRESFLRDRYNLLSNSSEFINLQFPVPFLPQLTDNDYTFGYINRYFIQKTNDKPITEIDEVQYGQFSSSPFYKVTSLKWMVSGPRNNIMEKSHVVREGVENHNVKEIQKSSLALPGMKQKLTNPLQFWKGQ